MKTHVNQNNTLPKSQSISVIRHQELRSGPIPSPDEMKKYAEIDSSLPNRIMTMAEEEQRHQYDLRKNIIDKRDLISSRDYSYDVKALRYCTFLCFIFMTLAAVLFYFDKTGAAAFFGIVAFVTLPKTYLAPRTNKTSKDKDKNSTNV